MAQQVLEIRYTIAALLIPTLVLIGIFIGAGLTPPAGHPVFGEAKTTPIRGTSVIGQPAETSILKPALSAVVNISLGVAIQEVTPELAKGFNAPPGKGALISDVRAGGPADKAGLQKGDVIEEINGQTVTGVNELRLQIAAMAPGTVGHLQTLRDGKERDVSVTLGKLPGKPGRNGPTSLREDTLMHGVRVDTVTPSVAQSMGVKPTTKGVVVTDVAPGTPASDAGLQRNDVIEEINRHPVANVTEYEHALRQVGKLTMVLLVNRGGQNSFVVAEPE